MRLRFHGGLVLAAHIAQSSVAARLLPDHDLVEAPELMTLTTLAELQAQAGSVAEAQQATTPATI